LATSEPWNGGSPSAASAPGDARAARPLYASFCTGAIHLTDAITAELAKVAENTYRDVNIAFANELALLSEELGADVHQVIALANRHPRVDILAPGPGVGGHCIPVDPHFLANANPFVTELIATSRRVNERMPEVVVRHVGELVPPRPGARVASEDARFGLPEVNLGYIPSAGGTQTLPRTVRRGTALAMILTGEPIDCDPAFREPGPRLEVLDRLGLERALIFPTLANLLEYSLDGDPDLTDLRCDAGYPQNRTGELIGTKSHIPVSNAERGVRRLDGAHARVADPPALGVARPPDPAGPVRAPAQQRTTR